MTREELAADVLDMLALQQSYFRAAPGEEKQNLLTQCKINEGRVRQACREIVKGAKPNLFDSGASSVG